MAFLCICRHVPGSKVKDYLKDNEGNPVSLKDVLNNCGSDGACCGQSKACMAGIRQVVEGHNAALSGKLPDSSSAGCNPA